MLNNFINPSFWFTLQPAEVGGLVGNSIFVFFLLLCVLGIVARIVSAQKEDRFMRLLGNRIGTSLITMGFLGVCLYFFSFERIRLFGSRFWYLVWVIGLIVWVIYLVRYAKKTLPEMEAKDFNRTERRKYFPSRKKKRR